MTFPHPTTRDPLIRRSGRLFVFDAGDLILSGPAGGSGKATGGAGLLTARSGQIATFARAGVGGSIRDGNGVLRRLVHSVPRLGAIAYGGVDEPVVLVEQAHANVVLQSENFGTTWSAVGTPTRSAAALTCGEAALDLLGDDASGTLEGYTQAVTFTGNGVRGVGCLIAQGTSTSTVIRLRDTTAGANRLLATITWSSGEPVVTMTTGSSLGVVALGGGVFLLQFQTTSVTAANTNSLEVYPATTSALATSATGTVYVGGLHAANDAAPGSYLASTSAAVTATADTLSWAIGFERQALTIYVRGFLLSAGYAISGSRNLLYLGNTSGTGPVIYIGDAGTQNGALFGRHDNGSTQSSSGAGPSADPYDLVEVRLAVAANGAVTFGVAVNEGTETVPSAGSAAALDTDWASSVLSLANGAFARVVVATGVRTLDQMRAAA